MSVTQLLHKKHRHPELVSGSIGRFTLPKRRQTQPHRQIGPMRVMFVDKVDFPRAVPVLQLLFAPDRTLHVAEHLKINETIDFIFRCVPGRRVVPMLPHTANKVRRHANVKRTVKRARKDIDAGLTLLSHGPNLAAKWTLKQVQGDGIIGGNVFSKKSHCTTQRHPELVSGSIGRFIGRWYGWRCRGRYGEKSKSQFYPAIRIDL